MYFDDLLVPGTRLNLFIMPHQIYKYTIEPGEDFSLQVLDELAVKREKHPYLYNFANKTISYQDLPYFKWDLNETKFIVDGSMTKRPEAWRIYNASLFLTDVFLEPYLDAHPILMSFSLILEIKPSYVVNPSLINITKEYPFFWEENKQRLPYEMAEPSDKHLEMLAEIN